MIQAACQEMRGVYIYKGLLMIRFNVCQTVSQARLLAYNIQIGDICILMNNIPKSSDSFTGKSEDFFKLRFYNLVMF